MLGRANLNFYDVAGFKFKQDEYSNSSSSSGGSDVGGTERIRMGSASPRSRRGAQAHGEYNILVIIMNWKDEQVTYTTETKAEKEMWLNTPSVRTAWDDNSFGRLTFPTAYQNRNGAVSQVITITVNKNIFAGCPLNEFEFEATTAALTQHGINTRDFNFVGHYLPQKSPDCNWRRASFYLYAGSSLLQHEIGHNLGMHHAWSGSNEYGDCTDVMGCGSLGKINLPHRLFMGWQDVSSMAAVQDMTLCSGNKKIIFYLHAYNIENPIASPDGGLSNVGLRIGDCEQNDVLYISTLGKKVMFHVCAGSGNYKQGCYNPVKKHELSLGGSITTDHGMDVPFTVKFDSAYDSSGLLMVEVSNCWDPDAGTLTVPPPRIPSAVTSILEVEYYMADDGKSCIVEDVIEPGHPLVGTSIDETLDHCRNAGSLFSKQWSTTVVAAENHPRGCFWGLDGNSYFIENDADDAAMHGLWTGVGGLCIRLPPPPPPPCEGLTQFRIRPLMGVVAGVSTMWHVSRIIFEDLDGNQIGTFDEFSSGWYNYPKLNGYSTGSAFAASGMWGGRSDADGKFYIGAFTAGAQVPAKIILQQQTTGHSASAIVIEGAASTAEPGSLGEEWVEIHRTDVFGQLSLPSSTTEFYLCIDELQRLASSSADDNTIALRENPCAVPASPSFMDLDCNSAVCAFVYTGIDGWRISNLISDPSFPGSPDQTIELGASGTNTLLKFPESGTNYGNSYGVMIMGYLKVPMNGAYTFDVYSDDSSAVYIEVKPGTWTEVVALNGCCTKTEGTTLVSLNVDRLYLVKILFKEGGQSDYVQVGFKQVGERCTDFPASLSSFATPKEVLAYRQLIARPPDCLASFITAATPCCCPTRTTNDISGGLGDDASLGDSASCKALWLCSENFHVVDHECVPCAPGTENAADDDASGDDTSCAVTICGEDERVEDFKCVACSPGRYKAKVDKIVKATAGTTGACARILCKEDEYVSSHACMPCAAGTTRPAGDKATSPTDTVCIATRCNADQHVVSNECVECPAGTTNDISKNAGGLGDDASLDDSNSCVARLCDVGQHFNGHECLPCAPGSTENAADDSSCDVTLCGEDERVEDFKCVACGPGYSNAAGDQATAGTTACDAIVCPQNKHVVDFVCRYCPKGSKNKGGDLAPDQDTDCDATI
eukprot:gene11048-25888_t